MLYRKYIRRQFSRAAGTYEAYAHIQQRVEDALFARICALGKKYRRILDIGTGTGRLLRRLFRVYPNADLCGLDLSWGMLAVAGGDGLKHRVQADARVIPFKEQRFDLVTSGLTYHWVGEFASAFREARRILMPGGVFCFSLFGEGSLKEIRECMAGVGLTMDVALASCDVLRNSLAAAGFSRCEIICQDQEELFGGFWEILHWMKRVGVNYCGARPLGLGGRDRLRRMNDIYEARFRNNGSVRLGFRRVLVISEVGG
ncbi:MAG: methyltransferase domain-containing protein [Candidatus Omnitrophota bacterium]